MSSEQTKRETRSGLREALTGYPDDARVTVRAATLRALLDALDRAEVTLTLYADIGFHGEPEEARAAIDVINKVPR